MDYRVDDDVDNDIEGDGNAGDGDTNDGGGDVEDDDGDDVHDVGDNGVSGKDGGDDDVDASSWTLVFGHVSNIVAQNKVCLAISAKWPNDASQHTLGSVWPCQQFRCAEDTIFGDINNTAQNTLVSGDDSKRVSTSVVDISQHSVYCAAVSLTWPESGVC